MKIKEEAVRAIAENFLQDKKNNAGMLIESFTNTLTFITNAECSHELIKTLQKIVDNLLDYEMLLAREKVEIYEQ